MKKCIITVIVAIVAGCAAPPLPVSLTNSFDADQAKRMLEKGTNTIKGSCRFQQKGAGVVTCAGKRVRLLPATDYSAERMLYLYKSEERGFLPEDVTRPAFADEPPGYEKLSLETTCDAKGFFKFEEVADGSFFVITEVSWQVGGFPQGGSLMRRVGVSGGQTKEIALEP